MQDSQLWQELQSSSSSEREAQALEKIVGNWRKENQPVQIDFKNMQGKRVPVAEWDKEASALTAAITVGNGTLVYKFKDNKNIPILLRE